MAQVERFRNGANGKFHHEVIVVGVRRIAPTGSSKAITPEVPLNAPRWPN